MALAVEASSGEEQQRRQGYGCSDWPPSQFLEPGTDTLIVGRRSDGLNAGFSAPSLCSARLQSAHPRLLKSGHSGLQHSHSVLPFGVSGLPPGHSDGASLRHATLEACADACGSVSERSGLNSACGGSNLGRPASGFEGYAAGSARGSSVSQRPETRLELLASGLEPYVEPYMAGIAPYVAGFEPCVLQSASSGRPAPALEYAAGLEPYIASLERPATSSERRASTPLQPNTGGWDAQFNVGVGALQPNTGGWDAQFNVGVGALQPNTGGWDAQFNVGVGALQPNTGGGDAQFNVGGGAPESNIGGGTAQSNTGGGPSQSNPGVGPTQSNAGGWDAQPNVGGGPSQSNTGVGIAQSNTTGWDRTPTTRGGRLATSQSLASLRSSSPTPVSPTFNQSYRATEEAFASEPGALRFDMGGGTWGGAAGDTGGSWQATQPERGQRGIQRGAVPDPGWADDRADTGAFRVDTGTMQERGQREIQRGSVSITSGADERADTGAFRFDTGVPRRERRPATAGQRDSHDTRGLRVNPKLDLGLTQDAGLRVDPRPTLESWLQHTVSATTGAPGVF